MTEQKQKNEAGSTVLAIGTGIAVLCLFVILTQILGAASFTAWPWVGAIIGVALLVIGYLQKIAARN